MQEIDKVRSLSLIVLQSELNDKQDKIGEKLGNS